MGLGILKDLIVYGSGFTFSGKSSREFPYPMVREIDLKQEAIKLIKELKKVPYAKRFCLGCGRIIRGQYCSNHPTEWILDEQTGDISAVIGYLMWFYKIKEEK